MHDCQEWQKGKHVHVRLHGKLEVACFSHEHNRRLAAKVVRDGLLRWGEAWSVMLWVGSHDLPLFSAHDDDLEFHALAEAASAAHTVR